MLPPTKWKLVLFVCAVTAHTGGSGPNSAQTAIGRAHGDAGESAIYDSERFSRRLFTAEDYEKFDRDGFLIKSGSLNNEIEDFVAAGDTVVSMSNKSEAFFSAMEMGMIFRAGTGLAANVTAAFRRVAFDSILPKAVAELLHVPPSTNIRILR